MRKGPIGISGLAGSGKDTLADIFIHILGGNAVKYSMASTIKKICRLFGFTDKQLSDRILKETVDPFWGVSPRWFAQTIGTEMFRNLFRDDVWVRLCEKFIKSNPDKIIVIPDIRFDNEAELAQRYDGIVLHISRNESGLQGDTAKHASEKGISGHLVTGALVNNEGFEHLIDLALHILKSNRYIHPDTSLDSDQIQSIIVKLKADSQGGK